MCCCWPCCCWPICSTPVCLTVWSFAGFPAALRYSLWLSLISSLISTILAMWVAVPLGYLLSRAHFRGKAILDAFVDIPIIVPSGRDRLEPGDSVSSVDSASRR